SNISGKDLTGTILDDEAASALSEGTAPFQAMYRPSEILSRFDGEFLNGKWKLQVTDFTGNTTGGTLKSWQIEVCYLPLSENYPPAAVNDAVTAKKDVPVTIHALDNDSDPNSDVLTIASVSVPAHGSAFAGSDSTLEYTPESGFTGTDSFVYTVSDGKGKTATATVSVTVEMNFALEFDGNDDYVDCGNGKSLNLTGPLTIEAWIKPSDWGEYGDAGFGRIVDKEKFLFFINNINGTTYNNQSLVVGLEHADGTFATSNTPANSIHLNEWQHVAVTYDGISSVKMYINGQEQTLRQNERLPSGPVADNSGYALYIGESAKKDRAFEGVIDEVRVWSVVRTQEEIKSAMNTELKGAEEGLAGYWPMLGERLLADRSGNGNDGEIVGTVWAQGAEIQEVLSPLANVILGLKILSGQTPERSTIADIDNSGMCDMPDVIYILREISETSTSAVMY
ncbi:MAG: hypothetical protein BWK80_22905, partial [Desulfobacteraceae bacterium IS3]